MPRYATIDVGTNSVLLLVADRLPDGRFQAVRERAEITRLGRGVDKSRRLSPEGMEATLQDTLQNFALAAFCAWQEGQAMPGAGAFACCCCCGCIAPAIEFAIITPIPAPAPIGARAHAAVSSR